MLAGCTISANKNVNERHERTWDMEKQLVSIYKLIPGKNLIKKRKVIENGKINTRK